MEFVERYELFGVETAQIPCIKGKGAPTSETVGAVGCFYMDTDTGELYKCVDVSDGSYTWEPIGARGYHFILIDEYEDGHYELHGDFDWDQIVRQYHNHAHVSCLVYHATVSGIVKEYLLSELFEVDGYAVFTMIDEFGCIHQLNVYSNGEIRHIQHENGGGAVDGAVLYTEQVLLEEQKAQARKNIGVGDAPRYFAVNTFNVGDNVLTAEMIGTAEHWSVDGTTLTHISTTAATGTEPLRISLGALAKAGDEWLVTFDSPHITEDLLYLSFGTEAKTQTYNGNTSFEIALRVKENGDDLLLTPEKRFNGTLSNLQIRKITADGTTPYVFVTKSIANLDRQLAKTGFWNVILGTEATMTNALNSSRTIAIGHNVLHSLRSGNRNIGIGTFAMQQMNDGEDNLAIGADSMGYLDSATRCTAFGVKSMVGYTTRLVDNTAIGWAAGKSGNQVTAIGSHAGVANTGDDNTFIGCRAGMNNTTGSRNIIIGSGTYGKPTGSFIVCIGRGADYANGSTNVVAIGRDAVATNSNQVVIGNKNITEVILGGKKLVFNTDGTVTWEAVT